MVSPNPSPAVQADMESFRGILGGVTTTLRTEIQPIGGPTPITWLGTTVATIWNNISVLRLSTTQREPGSGQVDNIVFSRKETALQVSERDGSSGMTKIITTRTNMAAPYPMAHTIATPSFVTAVAQTGLLPTEYAFQQIVPSCCLNQTATSVRQSTECGLVKSTSTGTPRTAIQVIVPEGVSLGPMSDATSVLITAITTDT